ncbi:hypothetical protein H2199_002417 [Coniosporium tulheliwenetii]|uniref:Uncharacterized protein n=1 Tax=Coniosporium tulheliwenetii TaxID=3383036 RepID=A0ACC2ZFK1_9PEZI|nr:hypothetical protein H2199_002417 [Cladosporium sp. JES 115]
MSFNFPADLMDMQTITRSSPNTQDWLDCCVTEPWTEVADDPVFYQTSRIESNLPSPLLRWEPESSQLWPHSSFGGPQITAVVSPFGRHGTQRDQQELLIPGDQSTSTVPDLQGDDPWFPSPEVSGHVPVSSYPEGHQPNPESSTNFLRSEPGVEVYADRGEYPRNSGQVAVPALPFQAESSSMQRQQYPYNAQPIHHQSRPPIAEGYAPHVLNASHGPEFPVLSSQNYSVYSLEIPPNAYPAIGQVPLSQYHPNLLFPPFHYYSNHVPELTPDASPPQREPQLAGSHREPRDTTFQQRRPT